MYVAIARPIPCAKAQAMATRSPVLDRPWVRLTAIAVIAFLYGRVTASLPAPDQPDAFWPGNIGAPYLLIPFLAGAWRFGLAGSAVAGGLGAGAMILGFYDVLAVAGNSNSSMELPLETPNLERIGHAYGRFFGTFVFGQPGGIPWLTIAIVLGGLGLLGYRWSTRGSRLAGAIIAAPFLVEPIIYLFGLETLRFFRGDAYANDLRNTVLWAVELAVGLILLWWLAVRVVRVAIDRLSVSSICAARLLTTRRPPRPRRTSRRLRVGHPR